MKFVRYAMLAVSLFVLGVAGRTTLWAADPQAQPQSNDDELRKSLEDQSMRDYDRELLGDAASKAKEKEPARPENPAKREKDNKPADKIKPSDEIKPVEQGKPNGATLPQRLQREPGAAATAEAADKPPMAKVVEAMRDVQPRLARRDAGQTTLHIEDQIVSDLDKLVEAARKSCSGGQCKNSTSAKKPSGGEKPGQPSAGTAKVAAPHEGPARASNEKRTAALPSESEKDPRDFHSLVKRLWGELPETERRQMLALPDEEFLPQYEEQTKQYLRRLSEGKKSSERQP